MKKYLVFILAICLLIPSLSQANKQLKFNIANTDGVFATITNPAALGFGNAGGIGYLQGFSKDKLESNNYDFIINLNHLGYSYSKSPTDYLHRIALGYRLGETNLYLGSDYVWNEQRDAFNSSLLFRPFDFLSLGSNWKNSFAQDQALELGISLRPLGYVSDFWTGLTFNYDKTYKQSSWGKGIFSVNLEPAAGFEFTFSNDFAKEEYAVGFSISFSHFKFGSNYSENGEAHGYSYVDISSKPFKNILAKSEQNEFFDYKLKGEVVNQIPISKIGPFRIISSKETTLEEILQTIEELKNDKNIEGIVFKSGNISTSRASFREIQEALLDFKESGKKIVYYFENTTNMNYTLAAAVADKIYLNPSGSLFLNGISISSPYLKNALDTLGIDVVNFRSHDFKTAGNIFSEENMTKAERKMYEKLLSDLYENMVQNISSGRGLSKEKVQTLINAGPYFVAQKALDAGLIDGMIFEDELEDKIKKEFGTGEIVETYKTEFVRKDWSDENLRKIALIYATGPIHSGKGIPGKSIGSESLSKNLKSAREDTAIDGIILRVNSGGGSVLASDIIAHEVEKCTQGKNAKPIIASMSGVAASGGYYISSPADKIIAEPETITGSIGVIAIVPNFSKLYEKIHVNWDTVKKGKNADIFATHRPMTKHEKEKIESSVKHNYSEFIDFVAETRDMSRQEVHKIAQGRVWTGQSAKELGLVDELGGIRYSINLMKKLCNIPAEQEVNIVKYPANKSGFLQINLSGMSLLNEPKLKLPKQLEEFKQMMENWQNFKDERIFYLYPSEFWQKEK